ncbi:MAG: hypothetical protein GYB31_02385 [Bacteroidetes bacterium]|nr:hypothetical protein [Bacteroidota bacterium]
MRNLIFILAILIGSNLYAQEVSDSIPDVQTYRIVTANGLEFIGTIIEEDNREVLFRTAEGRELYIPQYEIEERQAITSKDYNAEGKYIGEDKFATRYFLTTNGLPVKKGEHYIQWNLFGPDFQFGVADNFGMGVMSSWVGVPVVATAKYSMQLGEKSQMAVGFLAGSGTWAFPDYGGILPYATFSFGSRKSNIAFSGGYGGIWVEGEFQGRALTNVAGMAKVGPRLSLVFDSFLMLPGKTTLEQELQYNPETGMEEFVEVERKRPMIGILIPGLRWHISTGNAFQFGFTGIYANEEFVPVPIPTVQWYRVF